MELVSLQLVPEPFGSLDQAINLTVARSMERAKEVGVRRVIGAFRKQLVSQ